MPSDVLERLHSEDQALAAMHKSDTVDGVALTPEDEATYRELIEGQRSGHQAVIVEVKDAGTGATDIQVVRRDIGNKALTGLAVHSDSWRTEQR